MQLPLIIALALVFAASVLAVVGAAQWMAQARRGRRARSIGRVAVGLKPAPPPAGQRKRWEGVLESLSRLSLPEGGWQDSALRLRFVRAGFRDATAPKVYYAVKTLGTMVMPVLAGLSLWQALPAMPLPKLALGVLLVAALGYYLPDVYLRMRTRRRTADMRDVLPDLMDLLVICTESGMGMDAAINRVAQEIALSSKALAEEFYLAALEIRAGSGRPAALQNLALRVNLDDLYSLVSMLVQADKFGTSLAESLRVQSEMMRTKRMQRAEELAAKVPVKMLIPLVLFIFPALLAVLIGPAFIQIASVFGK